MKTPEDSAPAAAVLEQEIARIYESDAPGMLRYAVTVAGNPETAQDAIQEAFFRFFIARSAGQEFQSPKAWLYRVVRNYILDQKRSSSRREVGIESALNVPSSFQHSDCSSTADLLLRAGRIGLSAREVECFRLRGEGLRYEDIAGVLGLQCGTVGALLARAHGKIRMALGEERRGNRNVALPLVREKGYAS